MSIVLYIDIFTCFIFFTFYFILFYFIFYFMLLITLEIGKKSFKYNFDGG